MSGPTKLILRDSFFLMETPENLGDRLAVTLIVEGPSFPGGLQPILAVIIGLEWVGETGENWSFNGYTIAPIRGVKEMTRIRGQFQTSAFGQGYVDVDEDEVDL